MRFPLSSLLLLLTATSVLAALFGGHLQRFDARLADLDRIRGEVQQDGELPPPRESLAPPARATRHAASVTPVLDPLQATAQLSSTQALLDATTLRRQRFITLWAATVIAFTSATAAWILIRHAIAVSWPTRVSSRLSASS